MMKKSLYVATRSLGYILLLYAIFAGILVLLYPQQNALSFWNLRFTDHQLSTGAEYTAFAAAGLWITKTAFFAYKRSPGKPIEWLRRLFLYLQQHHVLIGWTVLLTTTAHGLYYILHQSDRLNMMVTGWIAWSALIVLAFLGVFFDTRLREKKKTKQIRLYHMGFALVFMVAMLLHVM